MKMIEIRTLELYEVIERGGYGRQCVMILSKDMPVPEREKRGRIRQLAGAVRTWGHPQKLLKLSSPQYNYRTQEYENARWVIDHDAPEDWQWEPKWASINHINRTWEEYEEEKEIQEEIRASREEERRLEQEQETQRYQKVKTWLDEMVPGHKARVTLAEGPSSYRGNRIMYTDSIEFWEHFIESLSKRL